MAQAGFAFSAQKLFALAWRGFTKFVVTGGRPEGRRRCGDGAVLVTGQRTTLGVVVSLEFFRRACDEFAVANGKPVRDIGVGLRLDPRSEAEVGGDVAAVPLL